jgi:hypothetical protein
LIECPKTRFVKWLLPLVLGIPAFFGHVSELAVARPQPGRVAQFKAQTVYVTRTGKKYHREGCRYLVRGKVPMTLKEAKAKGYAPCKVCHPPA